MLIQKVSMGRRIVRGKSHADKKARTLREYFENRNKVLIIREVGGLGDILMHRMMFEDFKAIYPDIAVVFACPAKYHEAVRDHPFIDEVLDSATANPGDYTNYFNTSVVCGRYETKLAPMSDLHRSDIWSRSCGITLKNHNMHLRLSEEEVAFGEETLARLPGMVGQKTVAFCPISAMLGKNMNRDQMGGVLNGLRSRGFYPFGLHHIPIGDIVEMRQPMVSGLSIRQWMGVLNAADFVISVDTSSFHCAGGLGKPMVGVFSFADGKVYGRYFKNWELVQKHRDNGDWDCGPCYNWCNCPKDTLSIVKPCMYEITPNQILSAFDRLLEKQNPA